MKTKMKASEVKTLEDFLSFLNQYEDDYPVVEADEIIERNGWAVDLLYGLDEGLVASDGEDRLYITENGYALYPVHHEATETEEGYYVVHGFDSVEEAEAYVRTVFGEVQDAAEVCEIRRTRGGRFSYVGWSDGIDTAAYYSDKDGYSVFEDKDTCIEALLSWGVSPERVKTEIEEDSFSKDSVFVVDMDRNYSIRRIPKKEVDISHDDEEIIVGVRVPRYKITEGLFRCVGVAYTEEEAKELVADFGGNGKKIYMWRFSTKPAVYELLK